MHPFFTPVIGALNPFLTQFTIDEVIFIRAKTYCTFIAADLFLLEPVTGASCRVLSVTWVVLFVGLTMLLEFSFSLLFSLP